MSELKSYINRVLGNSLRCLLPSYWWKRLFGLVVDEIGILGEKLQNAISSLKQNIDLMLGYVVVYVEDADKHVEHNKNMYNIIGSAYASNKPLYVYLDGLVALRVDYNQSAGMVENVDGKYMYYVVLYGYTCYPFTQSQRELLDVYYKLYEDGTIRGGFYSYSDSKLSLTSDRTVKNKVIAERLTPIVFLPFTETEEAKAMNADAYQQYIDARGNRHVIISGMLGGSVLNVVSSHGPLTNEPQHQYITLIWYDIGGGINETKIVPDGTATSVKLDSDAVEVDTELSEESSNAIANKTVTAALKNKVEKVDGKQLSTEDFTSLLKAKLEGLSNYDDSSIKNAINSLTTQINTLVSGDASVAIESFNEIIAFLNGIEDSESLDSIIAAIEQQIAGKQNTIDDLADIRRGAALGKTALQSVPAGYVTSDLLRQEITNVESQITGVSTTIPTKISQLDNDSRFTTEEYVNTQVRTAIISALNTEV